MKERCDHVLREAPLYDIYTNCEGPFAGFRSKIINLLDLLAQFIIEFFFFL